MDIVSATATRRLSPAHKLLSVFLAVVLAMGLCPLPGYAADTHTVTVNFVDEKGNSLGSQTGTGATGVSFDVKAANGQSFASSVADGINELQQAGYPIKDNDGWPGTSGVYGSSKATYNMVFYGDSKKLTKVTVYFVNREGASLGSTGGTASKGVSYSAKPSQGNSIADSVQGFINDQSAKGVTVLDYGGWPGASGTYPANDTTYTIRFSSTNKTTTVTVQYVDQDGVSLGNAVFTGTVGTSFTAKSTSGKSLVETVNDFIAKKQGEGYTLQSSNFPANGSWTETDQSFRVQFKDDPAKTTVSTVTVNVVSQDGADLGSAEQSGLLGTPYSTKDTEGKSLLDRVNAITDHHRADGYTVVSGQVPADGAYKAYDETYTITMALTPQAGEHKVSVLVKDTNNNNLGSLSFTARRGVQYSTATMSSTGATFPNEVRARVQTYLDEGYTKVSDDFPYENGVVGEADVTHTIVLQERLGTGTDQKGTVVFVDENNSVINPQVELEGKAGAQLGQQVMNTVNGIISNLQGKGYTLVSNEVRADATMDYDVSTDQVFTVRFQSPPKQNIANATVVLSPNSYTYDGAPKMPVPSVTMGSTRLQAGQDYTVSYANNANAGTGTVTVVGRGSYTGSKDAAFTIDKAKLTAAYAGETIAAGATPAMKVNVTGFVNGESEGSARGYVAPVATKPATLEAGKTYSITPSGGSADNYTFTYQAGTLTVSQAQQPSNPSTPTQPTQPSNPSTPTNPSTPSQPDNPSTPTQPSNPSTPTQPTNPSTPSQPDNPSTPSQPSNPSTPTQPSGPSTPTQPSNPDPEPAKIDISKLNASNGVPQTYNGQQQQQNFEVKDGNTTLVEGVDYTVAYESNTDAGTVKAIITGIGKYNGTIERTYPMSPAQISTAQATAETQQYTGQGLEPKPTVTFNGKTLVEGTDYRIAGYSSNVNTGTGYATIVGMGNFTGTLDVPFVIVNNTTGKKWTRLAGANRYGTMEKIAQAGFSSTKDGWGVLATGKNFPDALAASGLAGVYDCPVILTKPDALSTQARDRIAGLGIKNLFVMGGTAAVSQNVLVQAYQQLGIGYQRVAGSNRYATSVEIFNCIGRYNGWDSFDTVIVASGRVFPDALSISPYAYAKKVPILLADKSKLLTADEVRAITSHSNVRNVVVVGGDSAVDYAGIQRQLGDGYNYTHLAGSDRYATSKAVAEWELGQGMTVAAPAVATGSKFPDALTGAALCGKNNSVLVLASPSKTTALDVLIAHKNDIASGYFLGGNAVVSDQLASWIEQQTA